VHVAKPYKLRKKRRCSTKPKNPYNDFERKINKRMKRLERRSKRLNKSLMSPVAKNIVNHWQENKFIQ